MIKKQYYIIDVISNHCFSNNDDACWVAFIGDSTSFNSKKEAESFIKNNHDIFKNREVMIRKTYSHHDARGFL